MSRKLGHKMENVARRYLRRKGLKCITQNFSCKFGEIDLIMSYRRLLIFVEVKYRGNSAYGTSQEMVTPSKQKKLVKTAWHYIQIHPHYLDYDMRFDIVAIDQTALKPLTWIPNAFEDTME